jgi:branched-chain amino acid transport system permease protein
MFLQLLLNGICSASLFAISALGFSLVYNTTNIFHFAFGAIYATTAYLLYFFYLSLGLSQPVSITLSLLISALIGILIDLIVYQKIENKLNSPLAVLISSFSVYLFIINLIALLSGNEVKIIEKGIAQTFQIGSLIITKYQLISLITFVLIFILFLIFKTSKLGHILLGFSFNPKLIEVLGYNPKLIRIFVFFTSSILTGIASIISAFDIGFDPHVGLSIVLISAVALIIGGVKIFEGAILGAFLIGILQSIVIWKLSARWVDAFVFLLFIIFLLFKPTGLLGKKLRVEEIR